MLWEMFHFSFSFYFEVLFPMTNWNNKHHFRFCVVFLGLGLSVFSTIEGHEYEKEAETVLFNVEIIIVVWFAIEFLIRYVKFFFNTCTPSEEVDAWKIKTFCPLFKFYQLWNWVGYPFLGLSDLELKLFFWRSYISWKDTFWLEKWLQNYCCTGDFEKKKINHRNQTSFLWELH